MTIFEFKIEMKAFLTTFGESNYPAHRMELIWAEVKDLEPTSLRRINSTLIGEFKPSLGPKVSAFREYAETEKKKSKDRSNSAALYSPEFTAHEVVITFDTAQQASDAIRDFYRLLILDGKCPQWLRDDFTRYGEVSFSELSQQVEWFKTQVESGSVEARSEYVVHAKRLILGLVSRATFDGASLQMQFQRVYPKPILEVPVPSTELSTRAQID